MNFTVDWFTPTLPRLEAVLARRKINQWLEIGCFEGRSTVWFLQKWPEAQGVTIDPFTGSSDIPPELCEGVEARCRENLQPYEDRIALFTGTSQQILPNLTLRAFDFVYIDGSHETPDVYLDGMLALPLVKPRGLLVFDDYGWSNNQLGASVKVGVDRFVDACEWRIRRVECDPYIAAFEIV